MMCLIKYPGDQKETVLSYDLYLVKITNNRCNQKEFISGLQTFRYKAGELYKKGYLRRLRAAKKYELNGEVYHLYNLRSSKRLARNGLGVGIFMIPKGTPFYTGEFNEIGSTAVRYIGPLSTVGAEIILRQGKRDEKGNYTNEL